MARIDDYERKPSGMTEYLSMYGWHFSKRMAKFAAERFCNSMPLIETDKLSVIAKGTEIMQRNSGYDAHYLLCRLRTIHPTLPEATIIKMLDDTMRNTYDTIALTEFYADCIACNVSIIWEDMI